MNPQIDFADAKRVISNLALYISQKQNNINNMGDQTVVSQGMNLASQPELQSDHLVEETALTPTGISTETLTTGIENGYNPTAEGQESIGANNGQSSGSVYVEGQTQSSQLPPESMPAYNPVAENLGVEPQPQATSTILDTSAAALTKEAPAAVSATVNLSPSNDLEAVHSGEIIEEPAFVSVIPQGETSGQQTEALETNIDSQVTREDSEIPLIEPIPDVIAPQGNVGAEQQSEYVAVANGATVLSEQSQELTQEPVILPTGTTPDMANNQELVITPTSFGQVL